MCGCGDSELMRIILEELDHTNPPIPLSILSIDDLFMPVYGWFHHADTTKEIKKS